MAGAHLSKEFFDLIKSIGEAKSKQVRARGRGGRGAAAKRRRVRPPGVPFTCGAVS